MGEQALAVGMPKVPAPVGWKWVALTDVARLESGHTPSRKHSEYWGGDVPWLSIRDAKAHHAGDVHDTIENTNALGIENSSARILPAGTVCLSRTASVGYVVVMGRPMATSQDFVNWVCSKQLEPRFLQYLLIFEGPTLSRFSSGAVHQTIYFPEVKAFHICLPPLEEQRRIVAVLDEAFAAIATATANTEKSLANARELPGLLIDAVLGAESDQTTLTLSDVADPSCSLSYGIVQPGDDVEGGLPCVRPVDLRHEIVGLEGLKRIEPDIATAYQRTRLTGDEVLLCVRGTTGILSLASPELAGGNVTRGIVPIRFDPKLMTRGFGYYVMRSGAVQKQIRAATYGTALMQINIGDLKKIVVRVPSLKRQEQLAENLARLGVELATLQAAQSQKLIELAALKQSLLHRAFSGELTEREPLAA